MGEYRRPFSHKKFLLALLLTAIIFIAAFLIGYSISYSKYRSIFSSQEEIRYNLLSLEIEKQLVIDSCDTISFNSISKELDDMGTMMIALEQRLGKNNQRVLDQKKTYSLLEVQHFFLVKEFNYNCNENVQTLLFFYSNEGGFKAEGERIGFILDAYKRANPGVMVYSFDYDLDANLIVLLKQKYDIVKPNIVVLNENTVLAGISSIGDIERYVQ